MTWQPIGDEQRNGTRLIVSKWAWVHKDPSTVFDSDAPKVWHLCFATTAFYLADRCCWTDGLDRLVEPNFYMDCPPAPPEGSE